MSQPWLPEREVSAELARALIEAQFPSLTPAHVAPLGVGWDNVAYRVNDDHVFRFPQRQVGADLIDSERKLLPLIAPRVPVPVPVPQFVGQPAAEYPWQFLGYPYLPGAPACTADLDNAQRARLAAPLGEFLAALHAIPVAEARGCGAGPDPFGRLDLAKRGPIIRQRLEQIAAEGHVGHVGEVTPWLAIVDAAPAPPTAPEVLLHGDLYECHLLVDDAGSLSGIIDWGDVHVGHPATDLAVMHTFLPPAAYADFRAAYGPITPATEQLARFRALDYACIFVLTGRERGDAAVVRMGLRILRYLAA